MKEEVRRKPADWQLKEFPTTPKTEGTKQEVMFPVLKTGAEGCIKLGEVTQGQPALSEGISCHSELPGGI